MRNSILDLLVAPWATFALFTAVRLKIFTILSDTAMTLKEISSHCGAVPRLLGHLLHVLESMDLLVSRDSLYMNSPFARAYLVEGSSRFVGDLIDLQREESRQWHNLDKIILEGRLVEKDGCDRKIDSRTFIKAMDNLGKLGEADALKDFVDLTDCREMVDAGGGSGLYSVVLCRQYPGLRSTILDVKESLAIAEEMMSGQKERERIRLREADITRDSFGENVDVVLLSDIIYDEASADPVLKHSWDCLRPNGLLIIRGYYSDPENKNHLFGTLFVLNVLITNPDRKVLNITTLGDKVKDAGFSILKTSPLTERSMLLAARKQST